VDHERMPELPEESSAAAGRGRRRRPPAAALLAATAVALGVVIGLVALSLVRAATAPDSVELADHQVPAFPLTFADVPAGLTGPSLSLEPSVTGVGPGAAHARWRDLLDPTTGIGITVRPDPPDEDGEAVGRVTVGDAEAAVHRAPITGIGAEFSVVWQRRQGQWVVVTSSGVHGTEDAAVALARQVVDRSTPAPLQLARAPRGWVVTGYEDDRRLILADPSATGAAARSLTVSLPDPSTAPAEPPAGTTSSGARAREVTVHGQPGRLVRTADGWHLQAALPDGTAFTVRAADVLSPEQVVEVAEGVSRLR
jgi:hypothetical protein